MKISFVAWFCVLALVLGGGLIRNSLSAAESKNPLAASTAFVGTFKDERVTLEFSPLGAGRNPVELNGRIQYANQTFPFTATLQNGALAGTFESQGDRFGFTATLEGQILTFITEGTTYRLKKQSANPLARPASSNPLPQTSKELPSEPSGSAPSGGMIRFVNHSINDDAAMIGGEAFRMLIPAGWKVEGGVRWRIHPALPAFLGLRVSNTNGLETLEVLPTLPFVWAPAGTSFFPPGSNYMGNEVREPLDDPVEFIKRILLSRFRTNSLQSKVIAAEEMPKVAEAIAVASQEPGLQKSFKAARVRLEYPQQGKTMHEDIYCVVGLSYAPAINTTFWGAERNYSFKAEKGKLDEQTRVFQTMIGSLRPNLQWFNRYVQVVQILVQSPLDQLRRAGELSRFVSRTSEEINDGRRQAYENAQSAHDRISSSFSNYLRGVDEYHNPLENRAVELPSGYREAWANSAGEYILSDDPGFNPNIGTSSNWRRLERKN